MLRLEDSCQDASGPVTSILLIAIILISVIIVFGGTGNLVVVTTVIYQIYLPENLRKIKINPNYILLTNLAVADLLYCWVNLPIVLQTYIKVYNNGKSTHISDPGRFCSFGAFFRHTNAITEWCTLGLLALERYNSISRNISSRSITSPMPRPIEDGRPKVCRHFLTSRTTTILCVLMWLIAAALQLHTLLQQGNLKFGYNCDSMKCDFMAKNANGTIPFLNMREVYFLFEAAIPCALMIICYSAIGYKIKNIHGLPHGFGTNVCINAVATRNSRRTKLVLRLILVYLVCVVPMCLLNIFTPEGELGGNSVRFWSIAIYCLYWLQYGINHIVYFHSHSQFREALKQFVNRAIRRRMSRVNDLRLHERVPTVSETVPEDYSATEEQKKPIEFNVSDLKDVFARILSYERNDLVVQEVTQF